MIDGSSEISDEDINIFSSVTDKKTIFIINKSDLRCIVDEDMLKRCIEKSSPWLAGSAVISMSAKSGEGIDTLKDEIKRIVYNGEASAQDEVMITNVRHEQLLKNSLSLLDDAEEMLINGEALDFPESDIREAWMTLGEITGDAVTDDIVNEVFSRFCLGK
jgi:tRNA modification GTPase